jgi:hypothetical protein
MTTYLRVDDSGRYQACELVGGRWTRDLQVDPFETPHAACQFVAAHDGRTTFSVMTENRKVACPGDAHPPDTYPKDHPRDRAEHQRLWARHASVSDRVMTDGKAARTWMKCLHCPERREIVP